MDEGKSKLSCCAPNRPVEPGKNAPQLHGAVARESDSPVSVAIPGGKYMVGTNRAEIPVDGEAPLRISRGGSFGMDQITVTNARFRAFVKDTGYVTDAERLGNSFVFARFLPISAAPSPAVAAAPWWLMIDGACWHTPTGPGSETACLPDNPVVHVTWNDALAFARWAGGRLPSEAEWEHAARGGLGDVRFPWGDREPNDQDFFPCNIWQGRFPNKDLGLDGFVGAAPAKSFEPNGYGLYNMVGNVWEYTSQPFKVNSLKKDVRQAHAGKVGYKLSKGGSFLCHASYCYRYRIAARTGTSPDSSMSHQGFRLVYDE